MTKTLKGVARDVIPPVLYRGAKSLRRTKVSSAIAPAHPVEGELKPAEWYDGIYASSAEYRAHYVDSVYYPAWTVVADRISRLGAERVLDLGCGPGQFAALLHDRGVKSYLGLDFSETSVQLARALCPSYQFDQTDISAPGVVESHACDCVVSLEFLEHVDDDVGILRRIAPGTHVLATVPSYPSGGHVRFFSSADEVGERYVHLFDPLTIDPILLHSDGSTLYLMDGVKR